MLDEDARRGGTKHQRREPTLGENALVPRDRDAEEVAFALWLEGRKDDAIAFLEREILLEKDTLWKRDATEGRREPRFADVSLGSAAPKIVMPPPSAGPDSPALSSVTAASLAPQRRRRGMSPSPQNVEVSEPAFSDASAPIIELKAERVGEAPAPAAWAAGARETFTARLEGGRIGRGPAFVAAAGIIIIGLAALANLWDDRRNAMPEISAVRPEAPLTANVEANPAAPRAVKAPVTDVASIEEDTTAIPAMAEAPAVVPGEPVTDDASAEAPAPELAMAVPDTPADPAEADFAAPPDELDEAAFDPTEMGPPAPTTEPRLPRQRPAPPAAASLAPAPAPARATASAPIRVPVEVPLPEEVTPWSLDPAPPPAASLPRPFYSPTGEPQSETLTPEEYAALLQRRAWAEDYVAQKRALAEEPVPITRRPLLRLLRR